MASRRTVWLLAGLLAAGCPRAEGPAGPPGPKFALAVRYPPGSYVLTVDLASTQDLTEDGQARPRQELAQAVAFTMDVAAPDASGPKRMVLGCTRVRQDVTFGPRRLIYDSAAPGEQDPALAAVLAPFAKARLTVTLDREDRAADVAGLEGLWDAAPKDPPEAAEAVAAVRDHFSPDAIREMFARARQLVPDHPVAVGQGWETKVEFAVPLLGRVPMARECRLQAIEESGGSRVAVITFAAHGEPGSDDAAPAAGGIPLRLRVLALEQSGELRLDADTGLPLAQTGVGRGRVGLVATDALRADRAMTIAFETRMKVTVNTRPVGASPAKAGYALASKPGG